MTGWDRIVFQVCCTVTAVLMFDQAVFAGQFLGGSFGALHTHRVNATAAGIAVLVSAAAGLVVRLRGGPGWPALACLGLFGLTAAQIMLGFGRALTVHIPLGVAIIALTVGLTVWSWRRPKQAADEAGDETAAAPARPLAARR
jgi:heme A synthase